MSWLPVDYAARIILDLCDVPSSSPSGAHSANSAPPTLVYHVLNPTRFHWTRDMLPALSAAGLPFETLPTEQWMDKLRSSDSDPERNPPIKLLGWFESKYGHAASKKSKGALEYETKETARKSETVGRIPDVTDGEFVGRIVGWLKREWESGSKKARVERQ